MKDAIVIGVIIVLALVFIAGVVFSPSVESAVREIEADEHKFVGSVKSVGGNVKNDLKKL